MGFSRIAITGANGMLGQELSAYLKIKGYEVFAFTSAALNLLHDLDAITEKLSSVSPQIIIHAGAYTKVDNAEDEPELALTINKDGTRNIALLAQKINAIVVYISTDYVFDGLSQTPYVPTDRANPINTYGLSKYYGELVLKELSDTYYIIRTSWTYGIYKNNFVQWVLDSARQGSKLKIATDWVGSPTWIGNLCSTIETIIHSGAYGTYHAADDGVVSRYEQAITICELAGISSGFIEPVPLEALPFAANRPAYSPLSCPELNVSSWKTGLNAYLAQYRQQNP
ncbi:MAG: dTDP-4-dehydrorhamnose reductase [Cyanobacteria bacterium P01_H01_bin.74]